MKRYKSALYLSIFILVISLLFTINIAFTFQKFVDSYFLISALLTAILIFKLIFDRGGFDAYRYSWHKSKKHLLFFLPKYWKNPQEDDEIKNFDDFVEYRESRVLKSLPILLSTSIIHLIIAIIISLLIFYRI